MGGLRDGIWGETYCRRIVLVGRLRDGVKGREDKG
jgi:hypothetical protein